MRTFGSTERHSEDERLNLKVTWVWEGSTNRVLVMELMDRTSIGGDAVHRLPQADRNEVRLSSLPLPQNLRLYQRTHGDSSTRNQHFLKPLFVFFFDSIIVRVGVQNLM